MTILYWRDDGEDKFEDLVNVEAAYARANTIVCRYKRSVWFFDHREDGGFVRAFQHTRNSVLSEFVDKDMVPKPLQLLVLLEG